MNQRAFSWHLIVLLFCLLFNSVPLRAQLSEPTWRTVVEVQGLTSSMRDSLANDLKHTGDYKVSFACVPAGIIIIEETSSANRSSSRAEIQRSIDRCIPANRVTALDMDRKAAEAACAQFRGQ